MSVDEYVHVGRHADILASARHVGPGERVKPDELDLDDDERRGEDQHLIDEGVLVEAAGFGGESNVPDKAQAVRDAQLAKEAADAERRKAANAEGGANANS